MHKFNYKTFFFIWKNKIVSCFNSYCSSCCKKRRNMGNQYDINDITVTEYILIDE